AAQTCARKTIHGGQVRRDDVVPFGRLHAHEQIVARDTRVVDEYRRRTLRARDTVDDRVDSGFVAHVEDDAPAFEAGLAQPRVDGLRAGLARRGTDDRGALARERLGDRAADTAPSARHERDAAGEAGPIAERCELHGSSGAKLEARDYSRAARRRRTAAPAPTSTPPAAPYKCAATMTGPPVAAAVKGSGPNRCS